MIAAELKLSELALQLSDLLQRDAFPDPLFL